MRGKALDHLLLGRTKNIESNYGVEYVDQLPITPSENKLYLLSSGPTLYLYTNASWYSVGVALTVVTYQAGYADGDVSGYADGDVSGYA